MSASEKHDSTIEQPATEGDQVAIGSGTYNRILGFLYQEASLLDNNRFSEWGACLSEDLLYTAPLRQTNLLADQDATVIRSVQHYHDDYRSMMGRVLRLAGTKSAFAEDPPSRTRRLVTNVQARTTGTDGEFSVTSYLLVTRNRFDSDEFDLISGERHDILRADGDGFKLVRREIILDQALLGTPNLAIFL